MNPEKVDRSRLAHLEDLPNVGPATAADLHRIGVRHPRDLCGQDGYALYDTLCRKTGVRHDPCVIDVFLSITHFMNGGDALPWWSFTAQRKLHQRNVDAPR